MNRLWWFLASVSVAGPADGPPQPAEAACASGRGESCTAAGDIYARGVSVKRDRARAAELYERACTLGHGPGCVAFADGLRGGGTGTANPMRAVDAYGKGCDLGEALACRAVGDLHTTGELGEPNGRTAGAWYLRACDLGDAASCRAAGLWVERGDGAGVTTATNGLKLFATACNAGDHRACGLIAERYLRGSDGATRDAAVAYRWYGAGCAEPADIECCRALGAAMLEGKHVPLDREAGLRNLERACRSNDPAGCGLLAVARLEEGNWSEALFSAGLGCALGDDLSCKTEEKARAKVPGH